MGTKPAAMDGKATKAAEVRELFNLDVHGLWGRIDTNKGETLQLSTGNWIAWAKNCSLTHDHRNGTFDLHVHNGALVVKDNLNDYNHGYYETPFIIQGLSWLEAASVKDFLAQLSKKNDNDAKECGAIAAALKVRYDREFAQWEKTRAELKELNEIQQIEAHLKCYQTDKGFINALKALKIVSNFCR